MSRLKFSSLWIWVVLAFLILMGAWTTLIFVSTNNTPEIIPVEKQTGGH